MIDLFLITAIGFVILILLCIIRLIKGPTNADRMLSLDVINILVVCTMLVLAAAFRQMIFIDVAIIYALLSFVGTLYVAKLIRGDLQ
ncbi:MAG: monovalent cation/H+ antiporter complex subunit F [Methanocorpusculum sp.]|nr:monovalent cation/H+ antiporter complex subunit F [Methanocorpusculum sp.]